MTVTRLTFKEMCAEFDVTPRTLRYYEYIELLTPERDGRSRFYHAREVGRMKLIMRGRKFGFSLEDIRQWLDLYDTEEKNSSQMEAWVKLADSQMEELVTRRDQIDEAISGPAEAQRSGRERPVSQTALCSTNFTDTRISQKMAETDSTQSHFLPKSALQSALAET